MRAVKFSLLLVLGVAFATTACNTIENRRSEYTRKRGDGPYTRSLREGTWNKPKTVDEQFAEGKRVRKDQKMAPAPAVKPAAVTPDL